MTYNATQPRIKHIFIHSKADSMLEHYIPAVFVLISTVVEARVGGNTFIQTNETTATCVFTR